MTPDKVLIHVSLKEAAVNAFKGNVQFCNLIANSLKNYQELYNHCKGLGKNCIIHKLIAYYMKKYFDFEAKIWGNDDLYKLQWLYTGFQLDDEKIKVTQKEIDTYKDDVIKDKNIAFCLQKKITLPKMNIHDTFYLWTVQCLKYFYNDITTQMRCPLNAIDAKKG